MHFDYVDSTVENALAFEDGGYQFVGVTIGLIELAQERCESLARSARVANLLNLADELGAQERAHGGLFMIQLIFVVAHELGHHILGHTVSDTTEIFNEIEIDGRRGTVDEQACECFADAFAVFAVLGFILDGEHKDKIWALLGQTSGSREMGERVLLSALLLSASAFFFARPLTTIESIDTATHPPAVVRINGVIQSARTWCSSYRPNLDQWLSPDKIEETIAAGALVVGRENWREQVAFLESSNGKAYYERLGNSLQNAGPGSGVSPQRLASGKSVLPI